MRLCLGAAGRHDNENKTETPSAIEPSNVDVYHGFCALYAIMSYIVSSQLSADGSDWHAQPVGQALPSAVVSAGQHIASIGWPVFRLEIMEDVFSLLFSRIEHLRDATDSPDRQTDSEPENCDKDVIDPNSREFVFDPSGLNVHCEITDLDAAVTTHAISPAEKRHVGALTAESRGSPLDTSSPGTEGRSDEFSGSQTASNSSMQCGNESGFLVRDYVIRDILLLLHSCCEELTTEVLCMDKNSVPRDRPTADFLGPRVEALLGHVEDAQWRLRITTSPAKILPLSDHSQLKQRRRRSKRHRDSVTSKDSDTYPATSNSTHTENTVVPKMLSRPESLLNLCLTEGRIADAEEVVRVSTAGIISVKINLFCLK